MGVGLGLDFDLDRLFGGGRGPGDQRRGVAGLGFDFFEFQFLGTDGFSEKLASLLVIGVFRVAFS